MVRLRTSQRVEKEKACEDEVGTDVFVGASVLLGLQSMLVLLELAD